MSWVTPLFVPGESASVLAEGLLCHCGQGLLSCYSIELLSNCSGELGVPLELQQVIQGFFRKEGKKRKRKEGKKKKRRQEGKKRRGNS